MEDQEHVLAAPPEPGSYDAIKSVLTANGRGYDGKNAEVENVVRNVRSVMDDGHGLSFVQILKGGRVGRAYGSAQNPRGLPRIYETLDDVPAKQPRNGIIRRDHARAVIERADLTATEALVLALRWGLHFSGERFTQRAIADTRDVSQQAIAKTERRARKKVRAVLADDGFAGIPRHVNPSRNGNRK